MTDHVCVFVRGRSGCATCGKPWSPQCPNCSLPDCRHWQRMGIPAGGPERVLPWSSVPTAPPDDPLLDEKLDAAGDRERTRRELDRRARGEAS